MTEAQEQEGVRIASLTFEGNRITREKILMREMTFREGDLIPHDRLAHELERSKSNIWNLTLFNFVELDTCHYTADEIDVVLRVTERWYVWPIPFVEFADRNLREWWETKRWDRLDYGTLVKWSNFRGMNENLVLHLRFGFNNRYELRYEIPFLDRRQQWGIEFKGAYEQAHEVAYGSEGNKRVFYKNPHRHIRKEAIGAITPRYRPSLYDLHKLELTFTHAWIIDSVAALQPEYFGARENTSSYFSIEYELERDVTDYTNYPLKGYQIEFRFRKDGMRIFDSPIDLWSFELEYRKYWQLYKRLYFAHAQKIKVSSTNDQPYSLQRGLGYEKDFVRGYELYVIDGQHYGLIKTSLRFALLPMRKVKLKFIPSEKFNTLPLALYLNLNMDAGYVIDRQFEQGNPLSNTFLWGGGLGLDIVTFYDIEWRFEYSLNKQLEHGFFVHFTKHI